MHAPETLRCGVIGVGYLGQHHARLYAALPGVEFVGVCDVDAARAEAVTQEHGGKVFADVASLAQACDAVSLVVPTDRHAAVALEVLDATQGGCHLLIEKPICSRREEAEAIINAAQQAGVLVQVGHIEHFNPVMDYLEKAVQRPRFITADRLAPFNPRGTEVGVVLDLMIHDIGIILQLVKEPLERVDAVGVPVLTPHEDIANARLTFADGCVVNLNASRVSTKKVREIRVFQEAAYLSLDFMRQEGHFIRKQESGLVPETIPIEKEEPLKLELAAFVEAVRERKDPKVNGALGKTALELALTITDQIRAGKG